LITDVIVSKLHVVLTYPCAIILYLFDHAIPKQLANFQANACQCCLLHLRLSLPELADLMYGTPITLPMTTLMGHALTSVRRPTDVLHMTLSLHVAKARTEIKPVVCTVFCVVGS